MSYDHTTMRKQMIPTFESLCVKSRFYLFEVSLVHKNVILCTVTVGEKSAAKAKLVNNWWKLHRISKQLTSLTVQSVIEHVPLEDD